MDDSKENCPNCNADLQGQPIPKEYQSSYGGTHFSRKIGLYSMEIDKTVRYKCPDCQHEWKR